MKSIDAKDYYIHFSDNAYLQLNNFLKDSNFSKIIILTDSNSKKYCLDIFKSKVSKHISKSILTINIDNGEENKNITTCVSVWDSLKNLEADRHSLVINLGGGVVTDLGGFVASTYMRGITYINIPTTLLSMVDASIGGKTAVDLSGLKNLIGLITNPAMVVVDPIYLQTLPIVELKSGFSEMIKHSLISNERNWLKLQTNNINNFFAGECFYRSINTKNDIVINDPMEFGHRKILNFGHTIGHAVESFYLTSNLHKTKTHGECIAVGMVLESYISMKIKNLSINKCKNIKNYILSLYGKVKFNESEKLKIVELLQYDKKNKEGVIKFVLLNDIGSVSYDNIVSLDVIMESFDYYLS